MSYRKKFDRHIILRLQLYFNINILLSNFLSFNSSNYSCKKIVALLFVVIIVAKKMLRKTLFLFHLQTTAVA